MAGVGRICRRRGRDDASSSSSDEGCAMISPPLGLTIERGGDFDARNVILATEFGDWGRIKVWLGFNS